MKLMNIPIQFGLCFVSANGGGGLGVVGQGRDPYNKLILI